MAKPKKKPAKTKRAPQPDAAQTALSVMERVIGVKLAEPRQVKASRRPR